MYLCIRIYNLKIQYCVFYMCMSSIVQHISDPIDILTNILIHGMYVYMCMIIKLGIQEQRNMSIAMPCRQGVNLGLLR